MELKTVNRKTVARYLGIKSGVLDANTDALVTRAEEMVKQDAKIEYTYKLYNLEFEDDGICLVGTNLKLPGKGIRKLLKNSKQCIVLCATLGGQIDTKTRALAVKEPALAIVYDAVASEFIDQVCDDIQNEVKEKLPNMKQTWRYSAGYGDLPLELNGQILDVVNGPKLTGIKITEGGLMSPIKSISALFGLVDTEKTAEKESVKDLGYGPKLGCGEIEVCSECNLNATCNMSAVKQTK